MKGFRRLVLVASAICCAGLLLVGCGSYGVPSTRTAAGPSKSNIDSPEAAAACNPNGGATLIAAFASTAGVVAAWEDNSPEHHAGAGVWSFGASIARVIGSPWHHYPVNTVVFVCYYEGIFDGEGPPGCPNADKPTTRLIVVVYPPDNVKLTFASGFDNQLPVERPSAEGAESSTAGSPNPTGTPSPPPCAATPISNQPSVDTLSRPRDYSGSQVQLDPPGNAVAVLSASAALAACSSDGSAACATGTPSKEELALLTDLGFGDDRKLVWAITWSGVNCMVLGPPGRPSSGLNMKTGCEWVTFFDARTGTYLLAIIGPMSWG
jgi:hypothetical protein